MIYVYIQINKLVITSRVNDPWRASQPAWKMDPEGRAGCNNNAQAKPGLKTCVGSIGKWWKGQQIEGLQSQAGYKLRRASQARLANGSRKPCCVLHAPAREHSQPGNKVWTISSLRVKPTFMLIKLRVLKKKRKRSTKKATSKGLGKPGWLHAPACKEPERNLARKAQGTSRKWGDTCKDPKARLAPRSGVRAKPARQMDPESQAGSTLRRTNTTSPATGSKQQRAIAKPRVEKRRSVQRKGITNRAWKARLATRSGMKRKPAWRKLPERNAQLKTQQQGSVKPGWAHAPVCEPRQPGKLIVVVGAIVVAVLLLFLLLWWLLSFWFLYPSSSVVVLVVPLVLVPLVVLGFVVPVLRIFFRLPCLLFLLCFFFLFLFV